MCATAVGVWWEHRPDAAFLTRPRHQSHFASSRLVDFAVPLEEAVDELNAHARNVLAGPSMLWKPDQSGHTARAAYVRTAVRTAVSVLCALARNSHPSALGWAQLLAFLRL